MRRANSYILKVKIDRRSMGTRQTQQMLLVAGLAAK